MATPVPASCTTVGEFTALLVKPAVPEAAPEAFGVNFNVTGKLVPAGMVTGRVSPTIANSELVEPSDEIVAARPEAASVACKLALDPTVTLPKLRLEGVTVSCATVALTPVPWTWMFSGELGSLLLSVRMPVT